ncbi:DEAD/DEAH box helicase domain-containing protein [Candidatus Methanophagaceae archaeon]|nr:DEAD/DEAH box helicase domain-containing protein [Methanophagales archaeon]
MPIFYTNNFYVTTYMLVKTEQMEITMPDYSQSVVFFDLETQWLFQDINSQQKPLSGYGKARNRDSMAKELKLAVAGLMDHEGHVKFFTEDDIEALFNALESVDVIVGHNLLRFDYIVLSPYYSGVDVVKKFQGKTFDIMKELEKVTGIWTSLGDLGQLNLGFTKSEDTLKIPAMWRGGEHDRVKEYLRTDLELTKGIYEYGKTKGKLRYTHKDYGKIKGIRTVSVHWDT